MAHVTVRVTESAWQNLQRACFERGITIRGAFEAATHIFFLIGTDGEGELSDERYREVFEAAGKVARRLDEEGRRARLPRRKVGLRMDDVILAELKELCRGWGGLSINAVLATAFTPWGRGWGGPEEHQARGEVFERVVMDARRRDYERRVGRFSRAN